MQHFTHSHLYHHSEQWRPISRGPDSSSPERFSNYPPGQKETTRVAFVFRVTYTATNEWSGIQPANRRRNWTGLSPSAAYTTGRMESLHARVGRRESVRKKAIRSRLSRRSRPISWTNRAINIQPEYQSGEPHGDYFYWVGECRAASRDRFLFRRLERFSLGQRGWSDGGDFAIGKVGLILFLFGMWLVWRFLSFISVEMMRDSDFWK